MCTELAQEPTALKEIIAGEDAHELNRVAFSLPSRLISKKYLFRTIFNRGKGYAFTVDPEFMHVSTSVKYWDDVGEKFYTKYHAIEELYQKHERMVIEGKPLVGPLGRFWPIELKRGWRGDLEAPETLLVNYPTQGTGADVMSIARVSFANRINKLKLDQFKFVSTVHDSLIVDAHEKHKELIVHTFHKVFEDLPANIWKLFKYEWKTPLHCECKGGPDMKNQKLIELT